MFLFQINGVLFSFLFIKEPYAYYHGLHKYIKLFLTLIIKKKNIISNWATNQHIRKFMKDHVTLKTEKKLF